MNYRNLINQWLILSVMAVESCISQISAHTAIASEQKTNSSLQSLWNASPIVTYLSQMRVQGSDCRPFCVNVSDEELSFISPKGSKFRNALKCHSECEITVIRVIGEWFAILLVIVSLCYPLATIGSMASCDDIWSEMLSINTNNICLLQKLLLRAIYANKSSDFSLVFASNMTIIYDTKVVSLNGTRDLQT